ncbi:acyltransferase family protein [Skermanella rosea]|uniref:acyltransferase family protein n=1 Tax=Skermanella rosea TaxID=1817965 RepID=UPI001932B060
MRAFAALLVVFHHARYQITDFEVFYTGGVWLFGQAGVDIFFVISGFIMWVTTSLRPTAPGDFLRNRIVRIVPMYWLVTLAVAAAALLLPNLFRAVELTPEHVLKSLFFIPHFYPAAPNRIWPLLIPGWTLNYEMFFYLIFAAALFLPRSLIIPAISALFAAISVIGLVVPFEDPVLIFFADSIIMEFVAGMLIGRLYLEGRLALPAWAALSAIAVGLVWMVALTPWEIPETRLLVWGIPAVLTVVGCLSLEFRDAIRKNGLLTLLGDASYSVYLTHILTLGVVRTAWNRLGLVEQDAAAAWIFMAAAIVISAAAGIAAYFLLEAPIQRLGRGWTSRDGRRPGVSAGSRVTAVKSSG